MSDSTNIDLRKTAVDLLYGKNGFPQFGVPLILRKINRDANGNPIKCSCYDSVAGDIGASNCSYCRGLGYIFEDKMFIGAVVPPRLFKTTSTEVESLFPGKMEPDKVYIIGILNVEPTDRDKIIEPYIDTTISGAQPVRIKTIWDIESPYAVIGTNNTIAYHWIEVKSNTRGK